MTKYAIILPAGSGKSTIALKFDTVYDIDQFHTTSLKDSCSEALATGDWDRLHAQEYKIIHKRIRQLPENSIVLLHSRDKALVYNLTPLDSLKTTKAIMLDIAEKRKRTDGDWRKQITIYNWENTNARVCKTFQEIEEIVKGYVEKIAAK